MKTKKFFLERSVEIDGCWIWDRTISVSGYGQVSDGGKVSYAHRVSYTHLVGEIPKGLVIDHLCKNKECVNPEHLEPVTQAENVKRAMGNTTHCRSGKHVWNKTRQCLECAEDRRRANMKSCRVCFKVMLPQNLARHLRTH